MKHKFRAEMEWNEIGNLIELDFQFRKSLGTSSSVKISAFYFLLILNECVHSSWPLSSAKQR